MLLSYSIFYLMFVILCLSFGSTYTKDFNALCSTCRQLVDNFDKGLEKTANQNFGGGNTAWEERKLSRYESSEIRLMEILEGACVSSSFECNLMLEENEEHFETWWFKRKTKHPDLFKWFCVETIKVCCPKGSFGPDCNTCVGGAERPCHGNGKCDGDGTRAGNGKCSCDKGYEGEFCLDCSDGYFSELRNHTFSLCKDINECTKDSSPCAENQFCLNTDGSFSCKACNTGCSGCKGPGADSCLTCADGYKDDEGTCMEENKDVPELKSEGVQTGDSPEKHEDL
ncbi:cysteine-rich with EGF-like domain protein 2 isoform X2 [Pimephales promelas]|uniref:cysteine-rich with EGF-like domain protein 2 isoform X2 n=1 Tax=Pimephales promelas TaxID=90988 RepID=UPI001955CD84|nr:cysteine-rich with EGF-like domain protein 2 isoform X2 [Pimephales promelas]